MAAAADRFVFFLLVGSAGRHDGFQCQSGYNIKELLNGGRPALGCVDRLLGSSGNAPAFVDLMGPAIGPQQCAPRWPGIQAFSGRYSHLFKRELKRVCRASSRAWSGSSGEPQADCRPERRAADDRVGLLQQFDGIRRTSDKSGMMHAMDRFNQQAVGIPRPAVCRCARSYKGRSQAARAIHAAAEAGRRTILHGEGPTSSRKLLMARRLVEAGVRVVSVSISDFDTHSRIRHAISCRSWTMRWLRWKRTCVRVACSTVLVVAWGEFGRPR